MKKHRLTVKECQQQFPEAFQDANGNDDKRLDETMRRYMVHMINEGESPLDAKLKVLNIALHPDHFKTVPALGAWPKLAYHKDGKQTKLVEGEEELEALGKDWLLEPTTKHLDRLQRGSQLPDENIKRLERELAAERKKAEEAKQEVAA